MFSSSIKKSFAVQDNAPILSTLSSFSLSKPKNLSQDKFVKILSSGLPINWNHELTDIVEGPINTLNFKSGKTVQSEYIIDCSGSLSPLRPLFPPPKVNKTLQTLINVHFKVPHDKSVPKGMLHFIYNREGVGVYVCHDYGNDYNKGDWVMQLPFFQPYQSFTSFSSSMLRDLIANNFDIPKSDVEVKDINFWKMSVVEMEGYVKGGVVLAGDSAHVFPPAGGA